MPASRNARVGTGALACPAAAIFAAAALSRQLQAANRKPPTASQTPQKTDDYSHFQVPSVTRQYTPFR